MNNLQKYIPILLFCVCLLGNSAVVEAQKSIRLKLKPNTKQKYIYRADFIADRESKVVSFSSLQASKGNENSFYMEETIEDLNVFNRDNEQIFSMNAFFEVGEKRFQFQYFLKALELTREVNQDGQIIKNYNVDNIIQNYPYNHIRKLDSRLFKFWKSLERNDPFFYLNRKLTKGESFQHKHQFVGTGTDTEQSLLINYAVLDINDKYTALASNANVEIPINKRGKKSQLTQQGVCLIENSTGLILYCAEITDFSDQKFVYSLRRSDYKTIAPQQLSYLQRRKNRNDSKVEDIAGWGDISKRIKTKKELKKALRQVEIKTSLQKRGSRGNTDLRLSCKNKKLELMLRINKVNCLYCNKESAVVSSSFPEPFFLIPYKEFQNAPNVFMGKDCVVEKITGDMDVISYYGVSEQKITKKDVGKHFTLNYNDFTLLDWNENTITMSPYYFKAYNASGKQITKASVNYFWPHYKAVSKLLNIAEEKVSEEQAWLYSSILKGYHQADFIQVTFEEPVAKIVILDYKGSVSENKTIEISQPEQVKQVLEARTRKRLQNEKWRKEREKERIEYAKKKAQKAISQNEQIEIDEEEIEIIDVVEDKTDLVYVIVESMPKFPGGQSALHKFVKDNLQYPAQAKTQGINGRVFVRFIIEKDGKVTNVTVARGVNKLLDKEAIRVIESLPKWKAGSQKGKSVRVYYTLPVNFSL